MLAQPRKIRLVPRQTEATKRELLAPRLQACDRPVRHWGSPPEPVARSAEPRLSCGALVLVWDSSVPRCSHYGGLRFGASPSTPAPRAPLQAAASAARPIDGDRRQIFSDNSRCSGPWCGRTGFPPCAVTSPSHGENRGSSPLGSANAIKYLIQVHQLVSNNCPINVCGQAWTACRLDNMCGPCGLTTQILAPPCGWRIYVESPDVLV